MHESNGPTFYLRYHPQFGMPLFHQLFYQKINILISTNLYKSRYSLRKCNRHILSSKSSTHSFLDTLNLQESAYLHAENNYNKKENIFCYIKLKSTNHLLNLFQESASTTVPTIRFQKRLESKSPMAPTLQVKQFAIGLKGLDLKRVLEKFIHVNHSLHKLLTPQCRYTIGSKFL